jgi:ferric-dicitrate binding protein FerR (iron transport regulator)
MPRASSNRKICLTLQLYMSNLQPEEALYSLLCKYLLNEADAVERKWVEAWRMEQPVNEKVLGAIRQVLDASAPAAGGYPGIDTESSWQRLQAGIAGKEQPPLHFAAGDQPQAYAQAEEAESVKVVPLRRTFPWLRIAAILLIALGAAWWFRPGAAPEEQVFAGGQAALLEDGSKVDLQPDAALHLSSGFGRKERRVRFSGKAVFNVAQNAEAPFVVEMGQTEITVLGTEFSVEYGNNTGLTIHVSSGKILVADRQKGDSVVLTQGMLLRRNGKEAAFSVAENIPDLESRQLVFRNVPLHKVIAAVEAVYGIEVQVADTALLRQEITANFENEPIENVMATIAFMTNTQAEKTGQQQFSIK